MGAYLEERPMFVCVCNNVRESDIANAIADGAQSFADIQDMTGVANNCGQCANLALEISENLIQSSLFYSAA